MRGSTGIYTGWSFGQVPALDGPGTLAIVDLDGLLRAARAGGKRETDQLYVALRKAIASRLRHKLGFRGDDIYDLTQETLVRVLERLPGFEPQYPGAFPKWVYEITRRVAANHRSRVGNHKVRHAMLNRTADFYTPPMSPTTALDTSKKLALVESKAAELKTPLQKAIEHRLAGRTSREAAEIDGVSEATARRHAAESVAKVRKKLAQEWPSEIESPSST